MKKTFIKNVSFVFLANLIATIGSAVLSIIIPRLVSVADYGYWQLHSLYAGYVALLHFGWVDGVYIRYAGKDYNDLDKEKHHNQFWMLLIVECFLSIIGVLLCIFLIDDINKKFSLATVFIASAISIPMAYITYLFQGCNRIKDYSLATIFSKLLYLFLSIVIFLLGFKNFKLIVIASIVSLFICFLFVLFKSKDIVFCKHKRLTKSDFYETFENIRCGIKVSVAYLAGTFIIGSIKYLIEGEWGIETFGRASLTISMSNLLLVFINAVGLVLLPMIRNVDDNSRKDTYYNLYNVLTVLILASFILYYPMSKVLIWILPKYEESIKMMALIFPLCLFEGKMGLLNTIYLKALRKENGLLIINLASCAITICMAFIFVKIINNFELSILLILLMLAFRCTVADLYISKVLHVNNYCMICFGIIISASFVLTNALIDDYRVQFATYFSILFISCLFAIEKIKTSFKWTIVKLKRT